MVHEQRRLPGVCAASAGIAPCLPQDEDEDLDEDGFQDLVPTSLAELTANEEVHTAHFVEGDFFPEESPAPVELQSGDDRNEASRELLQDSSPLLPSSPSENRGPGTSSNDAGDEAFPSSLIGTRRTVKRVRWVDEGVAPMPLVQRATTFLLLHVDKEKQQQPQQVVELERVSQALSPPPVLREERNGDGTTYLSCKAHRPARRFVLWKRSKGTADASAEELPFKLQPPGNNPTTRTVTLLAALHPPYRAEHVGQAVLMRSATVAQSAKKGEALCDGGLQMPMVRVSELRNFPFWIPF
ncbi:hypothetical protein MOQ_008613 [Trypanosoma cruzi marinkellei]|uniref:Uncharacterized protein n=1 Tax=Trypanosoma cruzi marinkellei TaxID=85056 RepID=K2MZ87_TRYCR|nr:hypothetical protein MOQ_008613 [Trypanosoma cruzi marinkellei]